MPLSLIHISDAPHAREIIGGIAHQALHLNELSGRDTVFFLNGVHIHRHRFAASHDSGGKQHGGGAVSYTHLNLENAKKAILAEVEAELDAPQEEA